MKSAYLLMFNLLFKNNYEMLSASEAASDSIEQFVLFEGYFPVCLLPFVLCLLLCFVHSFSHLVQSQNDCYKVCSTTSWLTYCCWHSLLDDMFHNKER